VPDTSPPETEQAARVSTLELFFDLVFVFTATQLTAMLAGSLTVVTVLQVLLMLGIILWMYLGYAWLTNAVAPGVSRIRRTLLLVGMGGFLSIALAVPHAFGEAGWVFGLGYFLVNAVHSSLFVTFGRLGAARALIRLSSLNLVSATLVLIGGFLVGPGRYAAWCAAMAMQIVSPYLFPSRDLTLTPSHFVERHGLIVIVALGESIVAVGVGTSQLHLDLGLILVAVLGLTLTYLLWWVYFGGDEERPVEALTRIEPARRARAAVEAFGFGHYALLFGIVVFAAGVKKAIGHAWDPLTVPQALALAGGLAVFLAGDVAYRSILDLGGVRFRVLAAIAMFATLPLGAMAAVTQMAALAAIIIVMLTLEVVFGLEPMPA
jgi:low temperature requirement protein LtrA